ncbi:MAG TPA: ArsR family transcriptional regulator [Methanosarcinaceae archaeon]|nr:ArsR family transcriptional regulator [Methanosarcinaceae archaeon]
MSNTGNNIFKAIGSDTRLSMLERLAEGELHISGLARELNISVPVAAKHARILEDADLIKRKKFGRTHVLSINTKNIYAALDSLAPTKIIEVEKGTNLLDILKSVSAIEVKRVGNRDIVVSTDGEEGFYVYALDGKVSDKMVQECVFEDNATVEWKKLIPVTKTKLSINVRD